MKAIATISIVLLILGCGQDEANEPAPAESPPAPVRPEATPQPPAPANRLPNAVVWGGEGPAPDLNADIRACEQQVAGDPRAAEASPGSRFLANLACLGSKGWKARESEPSP